jgi:hypothetical protein
LIADHPVDRTTRILLYNSAIIQNSEPQAKKTKFFNKLLDGLTPNFFSFIGYNMDPEKFERTVAVRIAEAVVLEERADCALLAPA